LSALKDIPTVDKPLLTEAGTAKLQKTDIFRKLMWFSYNNDNNWHSIDCDRVREILEHNSKGIKPFNLKQDKAFEGEEDLSKSNRDLELLDKKFAGQVKKKRKKKPKPAVGSSNATAKSKIEEVPANKPDQAGQRERSAKSGSGRKPDHRKRPPKDPAKGPVSKPIDPAANAEGKPKEGKSNKRRNFSRNRGKGGQNRDNTNG